MKVLKRFFTVLCLVLVSTGSFSLAACDYGVNSSENSTIKSTSSELENDEGMGLVYTLNQDGESYSITAKGEYTNKVLFIPSLYRGKPVTAIAEFALSYTDLMEVVIPDSVTSIGNFAFWDCAQLTNVIIGKNVNTIGEGAFRDCSSLTKIEIPSSVTKIGDLAFYECDGLTSIRIPDGVTAIGNQTFSNCNSLESVVISNNVTSIGSLAFVNCSSLKNITIGNNVTTIADGAFAHCSSLTIVRLPDGITAIESNMFALCFNLDSVVIPKGITVIKDDAFYDCCRLKSVFYKGTESDWEKLFIEFGNGYLTAATRYYYSETEQSGCWYYDESGNMVLW